MSYLQREGDTEAITAATQRQRQSENCAETATTHTLAHTQHTAHTPHTHTHTSCKQQSNAQ